jgi:tetratricopeptide (TPR) repeat protein
MTHNNRTLVAQWTRNRAVILAAVCLTAGIAGGWGIRGKQTPAVTGSALAVAGTGQVSQNPTPDQLREMADVKAAPMLDKLKSNPNNPDLAAGIGNVYYDAQLYPIAVDYYGRALKARPSDAAVRTDMATAYWYMGNADQAIAEFNNALHYAPNNPNTLFNLGVVMLRGKMDAAGAIADWEKLLAANPNYGEKDKVNQMINEARNQPVKPDTKAN